MSKYFAILKPFRGNVKVELDLSVMQQKLI